MEKDDIIEMISRNSLEETAKKFFELYDALKFIADNGGKRVETECGDISCSGA